MYSSATVWEFMMKVSKAVGISPRYSTIELSNGEQVLDTQHGMVISQLGIKTGDTVSIKKKKLKEQIKPEPLVTEDKSALTERATEIFSEWFDLYKDQETNVMTDVGIGKFITNATRQNCGKDDGRVKGILDTYAVSEHSKENRCINLTEYLKFYKDASSSTDLSKQKAVK